MVWVLISEKSPQENVNKFNIIFKQKMATPLQYCHHWNGKTFQNGDCLLNHFNQTNPK